MIKGRKHVWCGRINWEGKDLCPVCKPYGPVPKEMYHFTDVIFDNPKIEDLAAKAKKMAEKMGMKIEIGYDSDQDNEAGEVIGALIIDGYITLYPEKIKKEGLTGEYEVDGWAIDVAIDVPGGRFEPPSVDVDRVNTYEHWLSALCKVFKMIFSEQLNNVAEGMQYEDQKPDEDLPF